MRRRIFAGFVFLVLTSGFLAAVVLQEPVVDKSRPAYEVYKNLKLFRDDRVSVARLDRFMEMINQVLGVECTHCHAQDEWHREDIEPEKVKARETLPKMWLMVGEINTEHFPDGGGPTCWTCHRGSTKPEGRPAGGWKPHAAPEPSPFSTKEGPAGEVYKNIQVFQRRTAAQLQSTMGILTANLGVDCTHCHVEGDWASDEKEPKQTARKMYLMRSAIRDKHFDGERAITCWTCHRGSTKPETSPAK